MEIELQTMQDVSEKVTRMVIDTTERRATLWTEQTLSMADGSKNVHEMIWDLNFSEDGTRITQILEFVDTHEATKVLEQILANMGGE
ncbi:hypothetical protein F4819DRAFT_470962 [Hypoxylon fuscum]|nr:hypothetical protein F4819DRAFT_470962 [Hypoxylon fuscum]